MSAAAAPLAPAGRARSLPPLGLYAHLPWCVSKCPYCDFNSRKAPRQLPEEAYWQALQADMESQPPAVWGRRVQTVFIGGGTPSMFSPAFVDKFLAHARALFLLADNAEVTMEANPESATDAGRLAEFRAAGVNRLSLGAQSFDDDALQRLQRAHNGNAAKRACAAVAKTFDNFNIDLMHALPAQTARAAAQDAKTAAAFAPTHLSLYQLTLEPGTPFFARPPRALPAADDAADIADAVANAAANAGFERYEVSAYCRPRRECKHNLNYWRFGDYLGVGAGAHAKITANGIVTREERVKDPQQYMRQKQPAVAKRRQVGGQEAVFEFMLNALRLADGFGLQLAQERVGALPLATWRALEAAEAEGLIRREGDNICPTPLGARHLNELLLRFLP